VSVDECLRGTVTPWVCDDIYGVKGDFYSIWMTAL